MTKPKRRTYDPEFKRNAVLLSEDPSRTHSEVAESLGISYAILYRWRREFSRNRGIAFSGQGNEILTDEKRRIKELEKKLRDAETERDILKKALAIFSRAPK
ncbi:transposase [Desulfovibrio gilichinskyi]|uniref:Transposase n=1 Tax=Desulfovibrio gilichinskyi TaxID=1519643 RepID=A0A1X7F4N8_9BACT|nr:transposase [Desulfovibrio gilichinskyi]